MVKVEADLGGEGRYEADGISREASRKERLCQAHEDGALAGVVQRLARSSLTSLSQLARVQEQHPLDRIDGLQTQRSNFRSASAFTLA